MMASALCRILVILAAFHVYCSDRLFPTTTRNAQLLDVTEDSTVTPLPLRSKNLANEKYIVQLYKALARGPKPLPFGAQFVRSFSGTGKSTKRYTLVNFHIRIPSNEDILNAMLHFCFEKEIPGDVSSLKVVEISSGKTVVGNRPQKKHSKCVLLQLAGMINATQQKGMAEIPISLKIYMRGTKGSKQNKLWFYWNGELSELKEIIVFSKETRPILPFIGLRPRKQQRKMKRREVQVQDNLSAKRGCSRKSLIVNFASLGYANIIAPTIFDAGQCVGQCQYPLGSMSNPTQHSLIQQLLHSLYGDKIAKSTCCAPRRFLPLTTMIDDEYSGSVAIRSLENMIVADCGCV